MFERVTKRYHTLETWRGHGATRYQNFLGRIPFL